MSTWSGAPQPNGLSLEAFVPALLRRRIADRPSTPLQPSSERFNGALLLTDVSGFSTLAERFTRRGPRGAEDLRDVLNFFCSHLAEAIEAHGGEVLTFAGDAALALWPAGDRSLADAAQCASRCALDIQRRLRDATPSPDVRLSMRIGLGVGHVVSVIVGGVEGRWHHLVAGDGLVQAVRAASAVAPGDIGAAGPLWALIAAEASGAPLAADVMRLDAVTATAKLPSPPPAPRGDEAWLRAFVPRTVQARLAAGQTNWLAECRRVTALFIELGVADYSDAAALQQLQRAMTAVQASVGRYGGSINQLVVDDKGTVVVCGWGLALHAHDDDQLRAVRATLDLRAAFQEAGVRGSFGLATGEVFAGVLGTGRRCEYAMIGDIVNVAARLMEAAEGDILCDFALYEAVSERIAFETARSVQLKGRERAVEAFRPVGASSDGGEMIGRVAERHLMRRRLDLLARNNAGGVVIVDGEPGIGKSRFVSDMIEHAVAKGIRTMIAVGDSIERSAPYHVWGTLLDNLLGIKAHAETGRAERRVLELLAANGRLLPFASLLNPVLRLSLPETESSRSAPPRGLSLLTQELLVYLLRCTAGDRATLLILEDAHWLDSASWALAEAMARELPEVLLFIAMRTTSAADRPQELARLMSGPGVVTIHLELLAPDEGRALICRRMRARVISEPVARLIREKAEGHPFFVEELVYALSDRGLIDVEQGVCRLTAAAGAVESMQLPDTVQVVVASRIDQLSVERQLTVKVASVFGHGFSLDALRAVYPIPVDLPDLSSQVEALVEHRLVQCTSLEPLTYEFKHAITQEVAYGLLPYQLRRQLHAAAAGWYEQEHGGDLVLLYPLLAHHWSRAEEASRAIFYLEKAGEQALKRHANEEALRFYAEVVSTDERLERADTETDVVRLSRHHVVSARDVSRTAWACRLGDASTNLSRWDQGRRHFREALTVSRHPLPASDREFAVGIARAITVQWTRRLGFRPFRPATGRAADLLKDAVGAYQRIGGISYQEGNVIALVYSLIMALNLAERLGPGHQFALACADVGNVLGLIPLRPLARVYQRMAFRMASRLADRVMSARIRARASLYRLGVGEWEACRDLETAMTLSDEIGDSYLWEENASIRARAAQLCGEFELAAQLGAKVRARAVLNRSLPHQIWGLAAETWASLHLGRHQYVLEQAQVGLRLLSSGTTGDQVATLDFLGAVALAHVGRGELGLAHQNAERLMEALAKGARPGYFAVLGLSAAAETSLAVWEAERTSGRGIQASRQAQHALARLKDYARVSPPARARVLLWRGCLQWLQDRPEAAQRSWGQCLRESERFALPYELARAHYEIGRRHEKSDARRDHLVRAETEFRRMRADVDLKRVADALAQGASLERSV